MKLFEAARDTLDRLADRVSDLFNPILVKETRQSLKSRQFISTFLLLLGVSWVAALLFVLGVVGQTVAPGRELFQIFYFVLVVTVLVVVPFAAYRSLQSERDHHTYEVLSVTTLKPRQILLGKLGSAVVQMFIYYSALMPFISFTYLLRGIDFPTILYFLGIGFVESIAISLVALTASTFSSQRQWQVLTTFGVLWLLVASTGLTLQSLRMKPEFNNAEFWFENASVLVAMLGYGLLLEQIAVAQLTFDSDNRSTGIRVVATFLQLLVMSVPVIEWLWLGSLKSLSPELILIALLQLAIIGIFFVTEPDKLSHRLERNLGRMKVARLPALLYYPGGSRGMLYLLSHLALLLGLAYWGFQTLASRHGFAFTRGLPSESEFWKRILIVSQYLVIYVGSAAALGQAGRAFFHDFRPALARVLAVIMGMGLTLVPLILDVAEVLPKLKPWVTFLNPIMLLSGNEPVGQEPTIMVTVWFALVLLATLPGMVSAMYQTFTSRTPEPIREIVVQPVPVKS